MSWLDEGKTQLLLTGAFEYGNDWSPLNGVAILDTKTGDVKPLGGGLMLAHRDQVVAPMIRHTLRGDEIWLAGLFDHAGVNANSRTEVPNPSSFIAVWNPTKEFKPAEGAAAPKAAAKAAGGGDDLPKSIAYKVEQIEKELDKAEKAIADGKARSAKRPVNQVERNLKDIERRKAPMDHPRIASALKRLEAIKSQIK
jgi:hypothetical protein